MGAELAKKLAGEGVDVIIHGRSASSADSVVAVTRGPGGSAKAILGDLGNWAEVDRIAQEVLATGPIDILINCHGSSTFSNDWFDTTIDNWLEQYQLVTIYAVQFIKAFVPGMRERR